MQSILGGQIEARNRKRVREVSKLVYAERLAKLQHAPANAFSSACSCAAHGDQHVANDVAGNEPRHQVSFYLPRNNFICDT